MLSLDSYYKVARQNFGGKIVSDNGELSATKNTTMSQDNIGHSDTPDPVRKHFCDLLDDKYGAGGNRSSGRVAEQVIESLRSRESAPLSAAEVNSAKHALKGGIGSQGIEWLTEKETGADRAGTLSKNILSRGRETYVTQGDFGLGQKWQDLRKEVGADIDDLTKAERQLNMGVNAERKESSRVQYLGLYTSLKEEGNVLSENRPVSDLTEDEMDLAVRTLTGLILAHEEMDEDALPEEAKGAPDKLQLLLNECWKKRFALSRRSAMQIAMVFDILHEHGTPPPNVRPAGWSKYTAVLQQVEDLKDQPGVDKKYMLRLKGEEGVKAIEIVSYNGFKGQLKRFWDWVSRNGLQENRAVLRELKNTCEDSGIFESEDFDNEIWQPALRTAGVSPKTSLTPAIIENILTSATSQAITTGRANNALSYGNMLPIHPEGVRDNEQLRDSLLKLLPDNDQWTNANRQKTFEDHINTETLYSIRNQTVANVVSIIDPFLSYTDEISKVDKGEVLKIFLDELEHQCQTYENPRTHPENEAVIPPAKTSPVSDKSTDSP